MAPEMQRILVTGASGFVGSWLCRHLVSHGFAVSGLVRTRSRCPDGVEPIVVKDIAELNAEDWAHLVAGVDVVVHCAAIAHELSLPVNEARREYHRVNIGATLALADAAARGGVSRFLFLSTVKVMGERTLPGKPFSYTSPVAPRNLYAESKSLAEEGLGAISSRSQMDLVIVRPPLVYGPGAAGNIALLMKCLQRGLPLPLASVKNARSMVSVENLVDLIRTCIVFPAPIAEVLLVSDGEDVSTPGLVERLAWSMDVKPRLFRVPVVLLELGARFVGRTGVVSRLSENLEVDISRTRRLLGWNPPYRMEDTVGKMAC